MYKLAIFVFFFAASSFCFEAAPIADINGEEYLLWVPLPRVRRQTNLDVDRTGRATISHTDTFLSNDNHQLTGTGFASKQLRQNGPLTVGGSVDYMHIPSGSTLGVAASNTGGFGTDFSASGKYNFYNKGNTHAYVGGEYHRHFGGLFGTGRPNYSVGLGIIHRW